MYSWVSHVVTECVCVCVCVCLPPVPLELQEGPPQVALPPRSRLSFRQQITGLFRPSQTGHHTGQTGSQSGAGADPANSQRRSNFFVEPVVKENRCEPCT